ncbi:hypothetical protein [Methylococcus capsulatus]|jgi:hypothetical protein|uniref:hypothetical protein n=1 Tax=Methylococcus capsulatus TaxID=414 RepID=UPI00059C5ED7|nr:hypothetical protein [Methylococcus capsulatus]QXP93824.1 hypothetical protein KW113_00915 [Methylococcus capsulatus]
MESFSPRELQKNQSSAGTPPGGEIYGWSDAPQDARRIITSGITKMLTRWHVVPFIVYNGVSIT